MRMRRFLLITSALVAGASAAPANLTEGATSNLTERDTCLSDALAVSL
jgi:hypothetical protein